ncbi:protein kinase domain-containing protein [Chromatium okenii]|uniref:protein kinase domain-containing protein n=1 Tax=Chromatium okenii TaxID=61644 RepID=UPI0018D568CC|nr:hypothetical protein [Chromatium okenii]
MFIHFEVITDAPTTQTRFHCNTVSGHACTIKDFIGGGGQGEVYRADLDGKALALKWYFSEQATPAQKINLEALIRAGAPSAQFLWPMDLVLDNYATASGFGYIMPLREPRFKGIVDLMKRRIEPSFYALSTASLQLAQAFLELHAKGLCYRDISFGNVFFDPNSGDIQICDNDNVAIDDGMAISGVLGTPRFIAPEIVRGAAVPSTQTDLFSLSVLLFYLLHIHHPLEGQREADIKCFDLPAMTQLYGINPLFIFDPTNKRIIRCAVFTTTLWNTGRCIRLFYATLYSSVYGWFARSAGTHSGK